MNRDKTRKLVLYALFVAIIILMAFTPLGYLRINPAMAITFITIPVVIGAIALGPLGGAVLGLVFGVTSFIQCFGLDAFGTALFAIDPVGCAFTCIVPRVLMGFLTGVVARVMLRAVKRDIFAYGVASLFGPVANTVLFMTSLMLIFGQSEAITSLRGGMQLFPFLAAFVGINGLVEAIVCFVVCTAVCKAISHYLPKWMGSEKPKEDSPADEKESQEK